MACYTIKKFKLNLCEGNIGGISKIWLANAGDVSAITIGTASTLTDEGITGITMRSGTTFVEYPIKKNTASMTSTLNVSDNGSSYVSTALAFNMPHMKADKRAAINALMLSEALALVLDSNGHYWLIGDTTNPMTNTAGTGETGVAKGDSNQYTAEMTAETAGYPYEVDSSIVSNIKTDDTKDDEE